MPKKIKLLLKPGIPESIFSMAADGKPNKQIISGIVFKLVPGTANAYGRINL